MRTAVVRSVRFTEMRCCSESLLSFIIFVLLPFSYGFLHSLSCFQWYCFDFAIVKTV